MSKTEARIVEPSGKPLLLVLSHLRWNFVFQRPQHLLTRAADDFDIVFMEEPVVADDHADFLTASPAAGVTVIQPVVRPSSIPDDAHEVQRRIVKQVSNEAGDRQIFVWLYTPMALWLVDGLTPEMIIFDKMDELSAFDFAPPDMKRAEAEVMERADIVFAGGASIFNAASGRHPNLHLFPSSIDETHFRQARTDCAGDSPDHRDIPHPRVGFFGVIDERIDQEMIADVARMRPAWQLVMIGPTAKIDPARLPQAENIHWLGGRAYDELPAYLAHWDLGWMPFARNAATEFISPTKTPEFLAAGLPLMSTAIRDVVDPYGQLGLVEIAETAEQMVAAGDRLLAESGRRQGWVAAVDAQLAGGSWDRTWADMRTLIFDMAATKRIRQNRNVVNV